MDPTGNEKARLTNIAYQVLAGMSANEDFLESPPLKKKFRCPFDGSTSVQKVSAIIEAAFHSLRLDGKTIFAAANSVLLNRYRPGKEPKKPYFLLLAGPAFIFFGFVMAGMMERGITAWIPFLPMALFGAGALWAYIHSCRRLADEHTAWENKVYVAEHHWHCHQCGGHFLPGRPGSYFPPEPNMESIEEASDGPPVHEEADEDVDDAPNIKPFRSS